MKSIVVLIMALMFWAPVASAAETHILLGVNGMSCPFCVFGIEKQLKKIEGVEAVSTDLPHGEVWVETTGKDVLTEDVARDLLKDAGFTLRSYETHEGAKPDHLDHEPGQDG